MVYLLAASILLAFGMMLYRAYAEERDMTTLLKGAVLIGIGIVFTAFSRSMIVYKPLMVLHIALTLLYWYGVVRYLVRREMNVPFLVAPLASIVLFFAVAWMFREI